MCLCAACGFGREDEESLPPALDTGVEPSRSVSEADNRKQEIRSGESGKEQLLSILLDKADFINCSEDGEYQEAVNIETIEKTFTSSEDITGEVTGFTIADMDGDGENEIVLLISTGSVDEGFEVLHYQDGIVYGYHFWYRALEEFKEDGRICG